MILVMSAVAEGITGCNKPSQSDSTTPNQSVALTLKVAVMRDGRIAADGSTVTLENLAAKLKDLSAKKGTVYYYREAGQEEEPHPNATKVIAAIIDNNLPVSLSSKPDFSDYVDMDGHSHKR